MRGGIGMGEGSGAKQPAKGEGKKALTPGGVFGSRWVKKRHALRGGTERWGGGRGKVLCLQNRGRGVGKEKDGSS